MKTYHRNMERRWMLSLLLIIGIIGYFTVPGIAGHIVHAGGGNGLLQKVNTLVSHSSGAAMQSGSMAGKRMANGAINLANAPFDIREGYQSTGKPNPADSYQANRLSGDKEIS